MIPFKQEKIKIGLNKVIIILLLIILTISADIYAREEFILLDEIDSGMEGIGKTVFSGTNVEEFTVQVIDIVTGGGIDDTYILIKLSGERIEENGGISAGMSGTPIYFEGRLAGAISHAWELSEHNLCLVTPIARMTKLLDYVKPENMVDINKDINTDIEEVSILLNNSLKEKVIEEITESKKNLNDIFSYNKFYTLKFESIQSPLFINGFSGRAERNIESIISKQFEKEIINVSSFPKYNSIPSINPEGKEIIPGSSVGVQLSVGDTNVLTIGTATYCEDDYVLAFGHPFMHFGDVSYLFSAVYIYHSFPSILMPFKLGFPYRLAGIVLQDREAGILAHLNHFPKIVSCRVNVRDIDKNTDIQKGTRIVPHNDLVESIVSALVLQSIDQAIDRIGQGTATVRLELLAGQVDDKMVYDNMFFSKNDIAIQCSADFEEIMDLVINNYGEKIILNEIKVDIDIKEENKSAILTDVSINEKEYLPGDIIEVELTIKPFRKPEESKFIKIELPENMETGEVILITRGGSSRDTIIERAISHEKERYLLNGWEDIKEKYQKKVKNNQIVTELIPINEMERMSLTNGEKKEDFSENNLKKIMDTSFVIEGYHEMYLSIKNEKNKDKDRAHE